MDKPVKRDLKLVRPLINTFITHYVSQFGEYPSKQIVERSIKALIKKKQEEFILSQFTGNNWSNIVDLVDVPSHVAERVMDLKEIDAKEENPKLSAAK